VKLLASISPEYDDFAEQQEPDVKVEFTEVKEYKYDEYFFIVIKENGEHFAVRSHRVNTFKLINE
jgi:hypothetical protein